MINCVLLFSVGIESRANIPSGSHALIRFCQIESGYFVFQEYEDFNLLLLWIVQLCAFSKLTIRNILLLCMSNSGIHCIKIEVFYKGFLQ